MPDSHDEFLRLISIERDHGKQESLLAELRIAIQAEQLPCPSESSVCCTRPESEHPDAFPYPVEILSLSSDHV